MQKERFKKVFWNFLFAIVKHRGQKMEQEKTVQEIFKDFTEKRKFKQSKNYGD